ncbi:universal stress protein [Loigolactobacillus iwatensis]|uniref:universal stress protein n=1 Tax=Loigolactobacillus iwatensis TaxID=1267156 RepID=UPI000F7EF777|nr:universal stress protein [Loigolactobacillus iwatensis]
MEDESKIILVGVDDSPDAQIAFRYAMKQAKNEMAELDIVSILETDNINVYEALSKDFIHGKRQALEEHLQDYRNMAKKVGIKKVQTIVAEGNPGETIVNDIIPKIKPDLLIIGSLGKKGVRKYFGSQAAYMAKYAPISVMIVR